MLDSSLRWNDGGNNMTIDRALNEYRDYLVGIQGVRESSARAYRYKLEKVLNHFVEGETGKKKLQMPIVTEAMMAAYMGQLRREVSQNTRRHTVTALKGFYGWLHRVHPEYDNPTVNMKPIKELKGMINVPTVQEVEKLILACGRDGFLQVRNSAILCVFADTGIRVSELCALKMRDIAVDGEQFVMQVPATKGNSGRSIPFAYQEVGAIVAEFFSYYYLTVKFTHGYGPNDPLFQRAAVYYKKRNGVYIEGMPTAYGSGPISRESVYQIVANAAKKCGMENIHPHTFRHFYATYLAAKGLDPIKIQARLGHATLDMVLKYIHLAEVIKGDAAKNNPLSGVKAGWKGGVKALRLVKSEE